MLLWPTLKSQQYRVQYVEQWRHILTGGYDETLAMHNLPSHITIMVSGILPF